jgi:hypothetical protein
MVLAVALTQVASGALVAARDATPSRIDAGCMPVRVLNAFARDRGVSAQERLALRRLAQALQRYPAKLIQYERHCASAFVKVGPTPPKYVRDCLAVANTTQLLSMFPTTFPPRVRRLAAKAQRVLRAHEQHGSTFCVPVS